MAKIEVGLRSNIVVFNEHRVLQLYQKELRFYIHISCSSLKALRCISHDYSAIRLQADLVKTRVQRKLSIMGLGISLGFQVFLNRLGDRLTRYWIQSRIR